jgi:Cu/Ag efflux protein CusF
MKTQTKLTLIGCGALALALATSATAVAAPPAGSAERTTTTTETGGGMGPSRTETTHATVTVTAVDKAARKLTIKNASGEKMTFQVPADVKSFDRLKVGDKVDIDYTESLALSMLPPGSKPAMTERQAAIPGAAGREMSISAEVVSVDAANNKVTFKGPRGQLKTVTVQDPELQAKLPGLKPGQVLQLTYTEAIATAVQPATK